MHKLLIYCLMAVGGLFAFSSCQADDPTPNPVETILKADVPLTVSYDLASAKEWEFQEDGVLKVYAQGRPSDGYVEVYGYERTGDNTIRLNMKGLDWPDGTYHPDAVPEPYMDISFHGLSSDGTIRAVLQPSKDGCIPTDLNFLLE